MTASPLSAPGASPRSPASGILDGLIADLEVTGMKLGLDTIRHVLAALGRPERDFPCVLVGGTNGKGSTSTLLAALAGASGARVGLFTSPHLVRWNERFAVDGHAIRDDDLLRLAGDLKALRSSDPRAAPMTFFEACTALALTWFRERRVDLAVLEVGMGGRLDSTNACEPVLSVVGSIDLDHTRHLGDTLEAIAWEKAGIVRAGGECVTHATGAGGEALVRLCRERGARVERFGHEFHAEGAPGEFRFRSAAGERTGPPLRLLGAHQVRNAALAIRAWERLVEEGVLSPAPREAVGRVLAGTGVPGRLERFPGPPETVLDGAHNPEGARALAGWLRSSRGAGQPQVLVVGISRDKAIPGMLAPLLREVDAAVCTAARSSRAENPGALAQAAREVGFAGPLWVAADCGDALARARVLAGPGGRVVVAGSLFLVGEAREVLAPDGGAER